MIFLVAGSSNRRSASSFKWDARRGIRILLTFIEGVIRIALFLIYLLIVSKMEDIRRVWMYHGAEHKTISCYESGAPLTVDNVRQCSRFHPRCGTSFLFLVMITSILVFAVIGWRSRFVNFIVRLVMLPVIAGISYEIIRFAGRHDNILTRWISRPGLALQRLTTAEPDDAMLEVAIAAMTAVLPQNPDDDEW